MYQFYLLVSLYVSKCFQYFPMTFQVSEWSNFSIIEIICSCRIRMIQKLTCACVCVHISFRTYQKRYSKRRRDCQINIQLFPSDRKEEQRRHKGYKQILLLYSLVYGDVYKVNQIEWLPWYTVHTWKMGFSSPLAMYTLAIQKPIQSGILLLFSFKPLQTRTVKSVLLKRVRIQHYDSHILNISLENKKEQASYKLFLTLLRGLNTQADGIV